MLSELDILKDVTGKFEQLNIQYMLTGSLAMSYYAQPRMTRDIDFVVNILPTVVIKMESTFAPDYYISIDSVNDAIDKEFIFNLIHTESSIKVDCIIRKNEEYRITEFERRQKIRLADFEIYIVSKEDLIISKLIWYNDGGSDLQKKDITNLLHSGYDKDYVLNWVKKINLEKQFEAIIND
jgi:hypothetical protein